MGYAYGYLCASRIIEVSERVFFLLEQIPGVTYEAMVDRMNRYILWPTAYIEEATACLAGMEASLGSLPTITHSSIEAGSKKVDLDMLLLFNSLSHIMNVGEGCSGFAAWGDTTVDSKTRAGGTVDSDRSTTSQYLLVVRRHSRLLPGPPKTIPEHYRHHVSPVGLAGTAIGGRVDILSHLQCHAIDQICIQILTL